MRLLIPLQSLLPFECQEHHILIVHKLIFDVSHSINQSEPQSVAIFVKGDSRQCGIERLSIVLPFYVILSLKFEGYGCHHRASLCPIGNVERTTDKIGSVEYVITIKRQLNRITIRVLKP